jgi:ABC-type Mn2+/Zn2+ transport system permease subunit
MHDLLDAIALFWDVWLVAVLLGAHLPLLGTLLVLRQQVFLGAAIGQASALGFAVGLWLGFVGGPAGHALHDPRALALGLGAAAATGVLAMRALSARASGIEARSVAIFLLGGSAAMLLLAEDPHGLEEVHRLQLSTLLGVAPADVWLAAATFGVTLLLLAACGRSVLLWATDPLTARVLGMRVLAFDLGIGVWLGVCIALAIHATGLLFAFGCTVLPVLLARECCGSLRGVLFAVPWIGGVGTAFAMVVAHGMDWPPGQVAVAAFAATLPFSRLHAVLMRSRRQ